jgi:ribonuclease HII
MTHLLICGVDEAGRGPLAGPVFAACVILREDDPIAGLADSKVLSPGRREELATQIRSRARAWAVASASVEEIDRINILRASLLAMQRAVEQLTIERWVALPRSALSRARDCGWRCAGSGDFSRVDPRQDRA